LRIAATSSSIVSSRKALSALSTTQDMAGTG
jgi:hypothetical protein